MMIYLAGSMKSEVIPLLANELRALKLEVFDDWHTPGPNTDEYWQAYESRRGRNYREALRGEHARTVFNFDKYHLDRADTGILVLPAGKSAHMEMGRLSAQGKRTYAYFPEGYPEKWDVMYAFFTDITDSKDELIAWLLL